MKQKLPYNITTRILTVLQSSDLIQISPCFTCVFVLMCVLSIILYIEANLRHYIIAPRITSYIFLQIKESINNTEYHYYTFKS